MRPWVACGDVGCQDTKGSQLLGKRVSLYADLERNGAVNSGNTSLGRLGLSTVWGKESQTAWSHSPASSRRRRNHSKRVQQMQALSPGGVPLSPSSEDLVVGPIE